MAGEQDLATEAWLRQLDKMAAECIGSLSLSFRLDDRQAVGDFSYSSADARLQVLLARYLETEKRRTVLKCAVVAFDAEQQAQLGRPRGQRNWGTAQTLYLAMLGISDNEMATIEGGLSSGGWIGSGTLYGATTLPMTLAAAAPSVFILAVPVVELQQQLVKVALIALVMQVSIALATPFVNSALQVVSVVRQAIMRGRGQPVRGSALKGPNYDKTAQKLRELVGDMRVFDAGSKEERAQLRGRLAELRRQVEARKQVIDHNYVGQQYQAYVRALRAMLTLVASSTGSITGSSHDGSLIQVVATVVCAALQLLFAAPRDQRNKMRAMLLSNVATVDVSAIAARYRDDEKKEKEKEKEKHAGPELNEVRAQWKGPIGTGLEQFGEWLDTERAVARQRADIALASALDADAACLKRDDWLAMSPSTRAVLLRAVEVEEGARPWRLAFTTAWARLRQPAEMISQIAQRVGSQFAMVIAGNNTQLIVSSLARFFNAQQTHQGHPRAISVGQMLLINTALTLFSIIMAFSMGASVNLKIEQRNQLKAKIDRVGFQPRQTPRALVAIARSIFALPTALLSRAKVESALVHANRMEKLLH